MAGGSVITVNSKSGTTQIAISSPTVVEYGRDSKRERLFETLGPIIADTEITPQRGCDSKVGRSVSVRLWPSSLLS